MSTESLRKRLAERCPGRWEATGDQLNGGMGVVATDRANGDLRVCETFADADSDLIAHAPTDLALALDVIEAVKRLRPDVSKSTHAERCPAAYFAEPCLCGRDRLLAALQAFEEAP